MAEGARYQAVKPHHQRVERKAPWEPRRVEGDGHVMATCGFTRPRSFTEDNARFTLAPMSQGGSASPKTMSVKKRSTSAMQEAGTRELIASPRRNPS